MNEKVKIALLYSGHVRSFNLVKECHLSLIKWLRDNYDLLIFCQTWDTPDANTPSWWGKEEYEGINEKNISETIKLNLKPTVLKINNKSDIESCETPKYFKSLISYEGIISMYFALYEAYRLLQRYCKDKSWSPDFVFRLRYDIEFDFLAIENYLNLPNYSNKVFAFASDNWFLSGAISDVFYILPFKESSIGFDLLAKFKDNTIISEYFKKYNSFVPEIFLTKLISNKFQIENIKGSLSIIRNNGSNLIISSLNKTLTPIQYLNKIKSRSCDIYESDELYTSDLIRFINNSKLEKYSELLLLELNFKILFNYLRKIELKANEIQLFYHILNLKNSVLRKTKKQIFATYLVGIVLKISRFMISIVKYWYN